MRSKKAIKNIFTSLIQNVVLIICGFIVPKLIITKYGSNVNGLIGSITEFLAYITLLESGIGPVIKSKLYKPLANNDKHELENVLYSSEKFFRSIVKIFMIYIIILCFIYPIIVNNEFDYIFTITLLIIISFSTIAEYCFGLTYELLLQSDQKTYVTATFRIVTTILNTIGVVILVMIGAHIFWVKLLSSLFLVLRPILLNYYVRKKYNFNLKKANRKYKLENKYDGLAQHVAAVVHGNTDIAVLTIFSSVVEVSVYSIYLLVIKGVKNLVSAFTGGMDASFGDMIAKGENKKLNESFKIYESFYYTIISIVYSCTILLIIPFVTIYTNGITDANYIRPVFAFLMVCAEYMHSIRLPYSSTTLAAGHFKETMKGAWIEAFSNILISIILVFKFGIIGVAIGTLFAMTIRTIEFNYHTSKYILNRNIFSGFIKPIVAIIQTLLIYFILNRLIVIDVVNYFDLIIYAVLIFMISSILILCINYILYRNEFNDIKRILKRILRKKA